MAITIWSGLVLGSIYALVATGFTIAMVPTGVFNFSQGAIVILGSFVAYQALASWGLPTLVALVITTAAGAMVGALCEVLAVRPLRWARGSVDNALVTTVGASTAVLGLAGVIWGYLALNVPWRGPHANLHLFGAVEAPAEVATFVLAVVAALGCEAFFRLTRQGQASLAVAEDRDAAMLRGVNVSALSLIAFAAAGAFGGLAGFIIGPITYAVVGLGASIALAGFVAVALGGEVSFIGGLMGGLVVGLVATFATRYFGANYANLTVFALLLVTLTLRPKGLGGSARARSV
jgi:branched-chain amino acid transport system permease protein